MPLTVEIYNLLVPAATARRLVPALAGQADWPLLPGDTLLITFTLLPTSAGTLGWHPVQPDTLPASRHLSFADLVGDGARRLARRELATKRRDHILFTRGNVVPIVWRQGQYWAPGTGTFVLTQYFLVRARPALTLAQVDYATINVQSPVIRYDAPWREIRAMLPASVDYPWSRNLTLGIAREGTYRGVSEFWSQPNLWMMDAGEFHFYGIHRFRYKPGFGVLSGEYQAYFQESTELSSQVIFTRALIDDKIPIKE